MGCMISQDTRSSTGCPSQEGRVVRLVENGLWWFAMVQSYEHFQVGCLSTKHMKHTIHGRNKLRMEHVKNGKWLPPHGPHGAVDFSRVGNLWRENLNIKDCIELVKHPVDLTWFKLSNMWQTLWLGVIFVHFQCSASRDCHILRWVPSRRCEWDEVVASKNGIKWDEVVPFPQDALEIKVVGGKSESWCHHCLKHGL